MWKRRNECTHLVEKQEKPKEEAVEICSQNPQVDGGGAGHFNHNGHEAVQPKHAQGKGCEQQCCKTRWQVTPQAHNNDFKQHRYSSDALKLSIFIS